MLKKLNYALNMKKTALGQILIKGARTWTTMEP